MVAHSVLLRVSNNIRSLRQQTRNLSQTAFIRTEKPGNSKKACYPKINLSPFPEMLKNTDEITARPRITSAPLHPFFIAEVESSFTAELQN